MEYEISNYSRKRLIRTFAAVMRTKIERFGRPVIWQKTPYWSEAFVPSLGEALPCLRWECEFPKETAHWDQLGYELEECAWTWQRWGQN